MATVLNKSRLDNLANEIWKSAERLRGKFKAYEYQNVILEPSKTDVVTTRRLREAGELMGITVLDHLIFNRNGHFSFLQSGVAF